MKTLFLFYKFWNHFEKNKSLYGGENECSAIVIIIRHPIYDVMTCMTSWSFFELLFF